MLCVLLLRMCYDVVCKLMYDVCMLFIYFKQNSSTSVKTTQNSTGGTGAHSAGKLTKTEVNGKEDS